MAAMGYVDVTPELDRDMSKLLMETDDIDSDFEEEVGHWARDYPFRKWSRAIGIGTPQRQRRYIYLAI